MSRRTALLCMTLVLLLAALARIANLLLESLWLDEGFSYYAVTHPDLVATLAADVHPPLYFLLLRGWIVLTGDSILAMRFLSVLLSLLSVALIYRLALELTARATAIRIAIIASLLLALSDADIYLAREVRMYSLRTLLALWSILGYVRWRRQPNPRRAFWWIISTAALVYTHYLGVYIPLVEGLHALLFMRGQLRWRAIGLLALSGLLLLPWLGIAFSQAASPSPLVVPFPAIWETLLDFRAKFFTGQWSLMIALALLGLVSLNFQEKPQGRLKGISVLLLLWIALPLTLTFLGARWLPILTDRNVMLVAPAIALLVAHGLGKLQPLARNLLVAAIVVYGVTTIDFARIKPRWDWVAADAQRYARPGDIALMENGPDDYPLGYYLEHELPPGTTIRSLRQWRNEHPNTYSAELAALLSEGRPVWLIYWSPDTYIFDQLTAAHYIRTATMTTDHLGSALNVYRYDVLPDEPVTAYAAGMTLRAFAIHTDLPRVDLWWSTEETLATDYSVSVFLLDANGRLVAQHDSYPFVNARPTTSWTPGEVIYDPHPLDVSGLPPGRYTVGVKVYTWQDGAVYPTLEGDEWATIGHLDIPDF